MPCSPTTRGCWRKLADSRCCSPRKAMPWWRQLRKQILKKRIKSAPGIRRDRLISLLMPFISNYSTKLKRFVGKLAKLEWAHQGASRSEGWVHGRSFAGVPDGDERKPRHRRQSACAVRAGTKQRQDLGQRLPA